MKKLKWIDENFEEIILVLLLCTIVCVMGIQVIARYVFGSSLSWSEELSRYLFVWSGFLSASYCIQRSCSVKIEQLLVLLSERMGNVVKLISYLIQITFFIYLLPFSWEYIEAAYTSQQMSAGCGLPMYLVEMITMISFILCAIRLLEKIIVRIIMLKKH